MTKIKNSGSKGVNEVKESEVEKSIFDLINDSMGEEDTAPWEGTVKDYLQKVIAKPSLNDNAHARIWRMIESHGVEFDEEDEKKKYPRYKFFENDLFGVDHVIARVMEYFKAAVSGSEEVSRRILLMWGPTSSGKSQFATLLKRGLEAFSKTKEGEIYALSESPMFENPLAAIPHSARASIRDKYGLVIEGELSPKMAYLLEHKYKGDFWKLPVKRIFLSEQNRVGIGTFQPGDSKCVGGDTIILTNSGLMRIEDMEELVENNKVKDLMCLDENGKEHEITTFFKYKNKEVVEINTELNFNITATQNHPLKIVNKDGDFEWKCAGLISAGDTLVLGKGDINFVGKELPENKLGLKWSSDLAWLLGVFIAEGSYRRNTVEISNCNKDVKNVVKNFAETINSTYIVRDDRITFTSKEFVNFLKDMEFKTGAHSKFIPPVVFTSGKYIKDFIQGMWIGDGNLGRHKSKNTNEASYSTVSKELGEQVRLLLLTLGIPASLHKEKDVGTSGAFKVQVTGKNVEKLQDVLNLPEWKITRKLTENKFSSPNTLRLPNIDNLLNKIYTKTWKGTNWYPYMNNKSRFSLESFQKFIKTAKENNIEQEYLNKLEKLSNKNIFYVDVKEVKNSISDVYDIEVPGIHYFIANGFISHNSQSQSELVGSVNFSKLEEYGVESHPMAYNFDGELNVSNRGMMEFIELLKVDPKFRHILLTLAQEKRIKVERFPLISADLVPISHTNETEYNKFIGDKTEEALHDRLWVVNFPYNLRLDDEVRIYKKLIYGNTGLSQTHIAPHTLKVAAMFAILSRLEEPKDKSVTILQKMHMYNEESVDGFSKEDAVELHKASEREGLDGVSPRYVVNRLAACFAKYNVSSITPIDALRSVKEGLGTNAKLDKEEVTRLENLISLCIEEYNKIAINEVQKAFFLNFETEIKNLLANYIDNVGAYLDDSKVENEWGEYEEPDERLMRSVEEKIGITISGADTFRQEVYRKMLESKKQDGSYEYKSHARLKEALQKQLFEERADVIRLTVSTRNPDEGALKRLNQVCETLIDKYDYTADSANELLRYVSNIMSKSN